MISGEKRLPTGCRVLWLSSEWSFRALAGRDVVRTNRRKTIFVDAEVQGGLLRRVGLYWAGFTGFAALLLMLVNLLSRPDLSATDHLLAVLSRHWPLLLVSLAVLPFALYDMLRFSHRFVGPLARVRRDLERFAAGDRIGQFCFRHNDFEFWQDLAVQINVLLNRVEEAERRAKTAESLLTERRRILMRERRRRECAELGGATAGKPPATLHSVAEPHRPVAQSSLVNPGCGGA